MSGQENANNAAERVSVDQQQQLIQLNVNASVADVKSRVADVMITLTPPTTVQQQRTPVDICAVVDVSGSMSTAATLKNLDGGSETTGLNLLDVVKHAVVTIAKVLGPQDRLAVVAFHSDARVVFDLAFMTPENQEAVCQAVSLLRCEDNTNLFAGIRDGIESLARKKQPGRASHVFVLTDGQPNVEPSGGHVAAVDKLFKSLEFRCTLSTFGFGYSIHSALLRDLAVLGGGNYVFIPDSSFVGTAFVNAVSHACTVIAQQVRVTIVPLNGAAIVEPNGKIKKSNTIGGHQVVHRLDGGGVTLATGVLDADTPKHIVLRMVLGIDKTQPYCNVTVDFNSTQPHKTTSVFQQVTARGIERSGGDDLHAQVLRIKMVELVAQLSADDDLFAARRQVAELVREMKPLQSHKLVAGLLADLEGQVSEAFSRPDFHSRWGKHYLPSLCRSHALEVCANFKDVGLQQYAGALFQQVQQVGDEIFCQLPAPKPAPPSESTLRSLGVTAVQWQAQAPTPAVDMADYYSSEGPCFPVSARVHMADGSLKAAGDVRRGDLVRTATGKPSRVECVVRTVAASGQFNIVTLPGTGLKVTPFHPVFGDGQWQFPINVRGRQLARETHPAVVSFLLDDRSPTMLIENTVVISLAHGRTDDAVAQHEFFGTERVVECLKKLNGFARGQVVLRSVDCIVRDVNTGRVCGLRECGSRGVVGVGGTLLYNFSE